MRSRAAEQRVANANQPASADEEKTSMIRYTKALMLTTQGAAALTLGLLGGTFLGGARASAAAVSNATVAFLMPDQGSTRYEEHDHPGFVAEMKKLCPGCKVLYQNADGDASRQQQQFNSVVSQGAKAIVIDPVDSTAAASLVKQAQAQGIKVIAYDRPIPSTRADYYVSFNNEEIGKSIARSLVDHLKAAKVPTSGVGLLEINGSPTDAAAGLIKKGVHEGLADGGYATLAEYDTPDWLPSKAQQWAGGQISRFNKKIVGVVAANDGTAGGAIAAFKAAGVNPVPPVTGNDATIAGLQLIISGDQYNTISKPSEIVAAAAADVAVALLGGETPRADTTLFDTPTRLFTPALVTAQNLKAEIVDKDINGKPIETPAVLCTGRYAEGCKKLGITP
jgi:D-xylose transport system substrate-binding protein